MLAKNKEIIVVSFTAQNVNPIIYVVLIFAKSIPAGIIMGMEVVNGMKAGLSIGCANAFLRSITDVNFKRKNAGNQIVILVNARILQLVAGGNAQTYGFFINQKNTHIVNQ